jgi:hypothetical protein
MLHFYASPLTHLVKPEGLPSRPDVNVILTLFVPLFQVRSPDLGYDAANIVLAFNNPLHWGKAELVQSATNTNDHLFHANPHSFPLCSLVLTNCVPAAQLRILHL